MTNTSCPPVYLSPDAYHADLAEQDRLIKITTSTIMLVLTIPTMLLNSLIIWVIFKTKSLYTPSYILLCSLALTDFGAALVSFPLNAYWKILELTGKTRDICTTFDIGFTFAFAFFSASELTVTALSVDRYLAIRLKSFYRAKVTNRRVVKAVAVIWCIAVLWAITSVHVEAKVLHATVLFVGVVTFGAIFACCGLSFKTLYSLETRNSISTSTNEGKFANKPGKRMSLEKKVKCHISEQEDTAAAKSDGNFEKNKELIIKQDLGFLRADGRASDHMSITDPTCLGIDNYLYKTLQIHASNHKHHQNEVELLTLNTPYDYNTAGLASSSKDDQRSHTTLVKIERKAFQEAREGEQRDQVGKQGKQDLTEKRMYFSEGPGVLQEQHHFTHAKKSTLSNSRHFQKKFKLMKYRYTMMTLAWIVVLLTLCYAPYFFLSFAVVTVGMTTKIVVAWSVTITGLCVNSFLNSLIYFWRFRDLRKACLKTLTSKFTQNE